jgi:hypothetical protein
MKKLFAILFLFTALSCFAANPTNLPVSYNTTTRAVIPSGLFTTVIARSGSSIYASNGETIIFTNTVPANFLGTNRTAHLILDCQIFNNTGSGSNFVVKVWFGSAIIFNGPTAALAAGTGVFKETRFDIRVSNLDSASSQTMDMLFHAGMSTSTPTTGTGGIAGSSTTGFPGSGIGSGVATYNTTTDAPFAVTITPSVVAPSLFYLRMKHATLLLE